MSICIAAAFVLWPAHTYIIDPLLHAPPKARTRHVIEAVLNDREKDLVALTDPDTSAQAVAWLKRVGPALRRRVGAGIKPEVRLFWQRGQDAQTIVHVPLDEPAPDPGPGARTKATEVGASLPPSPAKIFLFWKRAPRGDWLLVGNAL